ncbi:MAG: NADH-quinone oxidoreductase subunit A [Planctomycetota bacterium]|nr:MAG: NADH-quinone oxidoreductase subunit A [Planctomycetota bacterium]
MAFVFINMVIGSLIRPSRSTSDGLEPYECGEEVIGEAWFRFDIRYYTVALVYIVFAVEIAFLFPWAKVLTRAFAEEGIGGVALLEGFLFVGILLLGLAYVWVKGDLNWVKAFQLEFEQRKRLQQSLGQLPAKSRTTNTLPEDATS